MKINEWDVLFLFLIVCAVLCLWSIVDFYLTNRCPEGQRAAFFGPEKTRVCLDDRFIQQKGGDEYFFSRSLEENQTGYEQ